MPYSKEEQLRLPIYSNTCRVVQGEFEPFVIRNEAYSLSRACIGNGINIVDCQNPNRNSFINDADGLDFNTIRASLAVNNHFPNYIPIIEPTFYKENSGSIPTEVVGIALKDLLRVNISNSNGILKVSNFRIDQSILQYPVFKDKQVILFSSGRDSLIEPLWRDRDKLKYFEALSDIGLVAVTGINFSIFFGECPLSHAINLKKSLQSFKLAEDFVGMGIPHLYWANQNHLDRWVEWLNNNRKITLVNINCQCYELEDYKRIWWGIRYLVENVKSDLHFLLEGPSRHFLQSLTDIANLIHIANKEPVYCAMKYARSLYDGVGLSRCSTYNGDRSVLLHDNISDYARYLDEQFFSRFNQILVNPIKINKKYEKEKYSRHQA